MKPQCFTTVLTVLAVSSARIATAGDRHRCHLYQGETPPELTSTAEHWAGAAGANAMTLESLRGKVVWLQFNFWENCTPMRHHLVRWHDRYADESSEHVGRTTLVVYFYPADFTPGCSKQAEQFRDNMHKLVDQGVQVVGISGDSVETPCTSATGVSRTKLRESITAQCAHY